MHDQNKHQNSFFFAIKQIKKIPAHLQKTYNRDVSVLHLFQAKCLCQKNAS